MKNILLNLLAYERWANLRIISTLETTENPPTKAVTLMGHILAAQQIWFLRLTNNADSTTAWPETPIAALRTVAEQHYQQLTNWLLSKTNEELISIVSYRNLRGEGPFENTIQDILLHLSHHAPYHRGQVILLLKEVREDVPSTDYIVWKREDVVNYLDTSNANNTLPGSSPNMPYPEQTNSIPSETVGEAPSIEPPLP